MIHGHFSVTCTSSCLEIIQPVDIIAAMPKANSKNQ